MPDGAKPSRAVRNSSSEQDAEARPSITSYARIEIVYVEPPLPVILSQNARRVRPVPEKVIRELADKCEPPTLTEAHGLMIVCHE